jgi:hypothetical protein
MPVQFSDEAKKHAIVSLQRFCTDELDLDVAGVQTTMLLRTSIFLGR